MQVWLHWITAFFVISPNWGQPKCTSSSVNGKPKWAHHTVDPEKPKGTNYWFIQQYRRS